ncbi:CHASE domain-containing protein [Geminicoccaceae bacterium 1502E]|nr:CHASE domain-containing protein [Geminicoccaceae bacterium 1502E]
MRRFYPYLAGGLAMLATAALAWSLHQNEGAETASLLQEAAERIEGRIAAHVLLLHSVKGLYLGQGDNISRDQLQRFLSAMPIERKMPGIQGIGFAMAVPPAGPLAAVSQVARDYGIDRQPWPETAQDIRFPIVLLEPANERNRAALNYDMFSEPIRREAMLAAWHSGKPASTRPVQLVQEIDADKQAGFLIYLPLYRDGQSLSAEKPPAGDIVGFVYAPFRAGDLFRTVLGEPPALQVSVQAYSQRISEETRLFANARELVDPAVHTIDVAGRTWILLLGDSRPGAEGPSRPVLFVLALGCLLALVLGFLVRAQTRALAAAEALAAETKARSAEKDILLQEMNHRLKNLIARTLAIFRLSVHGADSQEALVASFGDRLQAMARAQDLFADSQWQRIELAELLDLEISRMAGEARLEVQGPPLGLDEVQSQAMGLVAHELTTNSLKYGALATDGTLAITWRLEQQKKGVRVLLDWIEKDLPETPDFSEPGFGSHLIRLMVERKLDGSVERLLSDRAVHYRFTFPLK